MYAWIYRKKEDGTIEKKHCNIAVNYDLFKSEGWSKFTDFRDLSTIEKAPSIVLDEIISPETRKYIRKKRED